jgi:hypothetical protein
MLLFLLAVGGCGGKGKVSGQVTFDGKPLPGGIVRFRPANTAFNPVSATIDQDGRYEATVPAGECKISVDNRALLGPSAGPVGITGGGKVGGRGAPSKGAATGPPKGVMDQVKVEKGVPEIVQQQRQAGTYVAIPKQYYDPETSGLTMTVKSGGQTHNIELTKK